MLHRDGKRFRLLGWLFLAVWIVFTVQEAKAYYFSGGYPILFAAGSVWILGAIQKKGLRWLKPVLTVGPLAPTVYLLPLALPVLPVDATIAHIARVGIEPEPGERHEMGALPQHFADMHGWQAMADTVASVCRKLTVDEQARCYIFVRNYGEAGAIDYFGQKLGLPNATCGHNNYWIWGPPDQPKDIGIIFGTEQNITESRADLEQHFESVEYATTFQCRYCMPYENQRPIFICRGMRGYLGTIWETQKHYN